MIFCVTTLIDLIENNINTLDEDFYQQQKYLYYSKREIFVNIVGKNIHQE